MATVDIILIVCFFPAIVQGITKGFIRQITGIVAVVAGAWASFAFSAVVSKWISSMMDNPNPTVVSVVSYAVIALVVIVGFILLGNLLSKSIDHLALGALNRFLGMVFSILKTALLLMLVIMLFEQVNNTFQLVGTGALKESIIYSTLNDLSHKIFPFMEKLVGGLTNV